MSSASERRRINSEAEAERNRREEERRLFKEAQELENLRRAFKRIDKKGDGKVDAQEVMEELTFLRHPVKADDAALIIWEVDDDADEAVDWEEFRTFFYRVRDDTTGDEPRNLFNVVEFIMHDKNYNGSIDLDECIAMLYQRFGKEIVDERVREFLGDGLDEKNISFTKFAAIQRASSKRRTLQKSSGGATMVPQVKGLSYVMDPTLAHLL